eukprot:CAMPEP_0206537900 /NCGR_PEP_ID=MMETSP0325_2-20121206/7568_1 /ASSEMBLY_ACC=CAM_ASM_000347 /TAXON_ID=2866 /ORGANISM="Crypthecodinium cohnii, Strain Seligo" /LENGTH=645 /DNA_ID=CAMNT_0054035287 /DNA_START=209 /DNA_END=2146 /DNA_ORIENTATION=-
MAAEAEAVGRPVFGEENAFEGRGFHEMQEDEARSDEGKDDQTGNPEGGDNPEAEMEEDPMPGQLSDYVDWAMRIAGGNGRFQSRANTKLGLPWMYAGVQTLIFVFVTLPPHRRHVCTQQQQCHIEPIDNSDCTIPEREYEYTDVEDTIAAEWDLICNTQVYIPLLSTIFFGGFLVGVYMLGSYADKRGRRPAFLWSWVIMQVGAVIATLSNKYSTYAFARLVTGFGCGGFGLVAYVWNAELLGAETRSILVLTTNLFFALGCLVMPLLSLIMPAWRHLSFFSCFVGFPFFLVYASTKESPKWLAMQGRASEVHDVMTDIATTNGRPAPPPFQKKSQHPENGNENLDDGDGVGGAAGAAGCGGELANGDEAKPVNNGSTIYQLFCDRRLALRFHVVAWAWFCLSLGYYGLSMNVSNLGPNIYMSSAMASLVEIPACLAAVKACDSILLGRRGTAGGGLALGGLCCLVSAFCIGGEDDEPSILMLALVFFGKFGVSASFCTIYLLSAELFPTTIRSEAMGLHSLAARAGGMMASLVANLGKTSKALPLIIFGLPCLASGISILLTMPETRGKPMMDTIEDFDRPPASSSGHHGGSVRAPVLRRPLAPVRRYRQLDEETNETKKGDGDGELELGNLPPPQSLGVASSP